MSETVSGDHRKVAEVNRLEDLFKAKLSPLINQWNAASSNQDGGTLRIQPNVRMLRVVSGGNRFWMGAWAGDSHIDIELGLIEVETGKKIGRPGISRSSNTNAMSGAADRNHATYIVDIAHQYLVAHY